MTEPYNKHNQTNEPVAHFWIGWKLPEGHWMDPADDQDCARCGRDVYSAATGTVVPWIENGQFIEEIAEGVCDAWCLWCFACNEDVYPVYNDAAHAKFDFNSGEADPPKGVYSLEEKKARDKRGLKTIEHGQKELEKVLAEREKVKARRKQRGMDLSRYGRMWTYPDEELKASGTDVPMKGPDEATIYG